MYITPTQTNAFKGVIDQEQAIAQLIVVLENREHLANTWIFTGPPGSGRMNVAQSFVRMLIGNDTDIMNHPDVKFITSNALSIKVDDIRDSIIQAETYPNVADYRIFIIENADNMTEVAQNALLKSIEEPSPTTIWILVAPSSEAVLPTIKSRARIVRLKTPSTTSIIQLLISEGIAPERAELSAKLSRGHVGIARQLATSDTKLDQRVRTLEEVLNIKSVANAVAVVEAVLTDIKAEYEEDINQKFANLTSTLRIQHGFEPTEAIPRSHRAIFKELEDEKALNLKRALRDYVDLMLHDILLGYRDIALLQLGAEATLLANTPVVAALKNVGESQTLQDTIYKFNYINQVRDEISQNANIELALIALFTKLLIPASARV